MGITCPNCGKTNIASGIVQCPACRHTLPSGPLAIRPPSGGGISSTRPVLVGARGRQYVLSPTAPSLIGSRGCAILLSEPGVPDQAARLTPYNSGMLLEDLCGAVVVNGNPLTTLYPLQQGDQINIGSALLVYQGQNTPMPGSKISPLPISPPVVSPLTPTPISLSSLPPGIVLKSWKTLPVVEGRVELVDGPHRVEKGSLGTKVATSLLLGAISSSLAMIPFWMQREITVWFLRIKDHTTRRLVSVILRGEPGSLPQLGDFIAVWGQVKDGNVLMRSGFSYTTDSDIRIKS